MFEVIVRDLGETVDDVKNFVLEQKRNAEKWYIGTIIAHASSSTAENRKLLDQERKRQGKAALKSARKAYQRNFSATAKGRWVDAAKEALQRANDKLDHL